ncbi:MAG: hypothetical protein AAF696_22500, partial [Bacteroidota bacterium]
EVVIATAEKEDITAIIVVVVAEAMATAEEVTTAVAEVAMAIVEREAITATTVVAEAAMAIAEKEDIIAVAAVVTEIVEKEVTTAAVGVTTTATEAIIEIITVIPDVMTHEIETTIPERKGIKTQQRDVAEEESVVLILSIPMITSDSTKHKTLIMPISRIQKMREEIKKIDPSLENRSRKSPECNVQGFFL